MLGINQINANLTDAPSFLEHMELGWNMAQKIKADGGRHFFLAAPTILNRQISEILKSAPTIQLSKCTNRNNGEFARDALVVAQKVQTAPTANIRLGCRPPLKQQYKKLQTFLKETPILNGSTDDEYFKRQFGADLDITVALLRKYLEFSYDFQFLLDSQGKIHHIDLDRLAHDKDYLKKAPTWRKFGVETNQTKRRDSYRRTNRTISCLSQFRQIVYSFDNK